MISHRLNKLFIILSILLTNVVVLSCAGSGVQNHEQVMSIAVWDLEDLSPVGQSKIGMGELLAGRIIDRLQQIEFCQVVERQQLVTALEELEIGSSELAANSNRLKLGKLLGARQMVFGAFQVVGGQVRLDLRRVEVASGKVLSTASAIANANVIDEWLNAAEKAAIELFD